mgnify:FL=1
MKQLFEDHTGQQITLEYETQNAVAVPAGELATE